MSVEAFKGISGGTQNPCRIVHKMESDLDQEGGLAKNNNGYNIFEVAMETNDVKPAVSADLPGEINASATVIEKEVDSHTHLFTERLPLALSSIPNGLTQPPRPKRGRKPKNQVKVAKDEEDNMKYPIVLKMESGCPVSSRKRKAELELEFYPFGEPERRRSPRFQGKVMPNMSENITKIIPPIRTERDIRREQKMRLASLKANVKVEMNLVVPVKANRSIQCDLPPVLSPHFNLKPKQTNNKKVVKKRGPRVKTEIPDSLVSSPPTLTPERSSKISTYENGNESLIKVERNSNHVFKREFSPDITEVFPRASRKIEKRLSSPRASSTLKGSLISPGAASTITEDLNSPEAPSTVKEGLISPGTPSTIKEHLLSPEHAFGNVESDEDWLLPMPTSPLPSPSEKADETPNATFPLVPLVPIIPIMPEITTKSYKVQKQHKAIFGRTEHVHILYDYTKMNHTGYESLEFWIGPVDLKIREKLAKAINNILENSSDSLVKITRWEPMGSLPGLKMPVMENLRSIRFSSWSGSLRRSPLLPIDCTPEICFPHLKEVHFDQLGLGNEKWEDFFPMLKKKRRDPFLDNIELPTVETLKLGEGSSKYLRNLGSMFPNCKNLSCEFFFFEFPQRAKDIWTNFPMLEYLKFQRKIVREDNLNCILDAAFTGFSTHTCKRLYLLPSEELRRTNPAISDDWREAPSIVELQYLEHLVMDLFIWDDQGLDGGGVSALSKVSGFFAFKMMPELKVKLITSYVNNPKKDLMKGLDSISPFLHTVERGKY